jgi:ubiquinone/menaquinone biosynthesis C-methylase UbiE
MAEIDLMRLYPRRSGRADERPAVTEEDRRVSKQFDKDYFDGDRRYGYGGYRYHERFWTDTVRLFRDHYELPGDASILDVGCGKGFMLYDFMKLMPKARLAGIDISEYAINNALEEVRPILRVANANSLPFADRSFDLVVSINTIHNLPPIECKESLKEIQRVARQHAFVMVDGWRNEREHHELLRWVLTPETMLHVDDWLELFGQAGYTHDYFWWGVA